MSVRIIEDGDIVLKTSYQWIRESNYRLLNYDGWDKENLEYSFYKEKISKVEFTLRLSKSKNEKYFIKIWR